MSALEARVGALSKRLLGSPVFFTGMLLLMALMLAVAGLSGAPPSTAAASPAASQRLDPTIGIVGVLVLLPAFVLLLRARAKRIAEHDREKIRLKNMRAVLGLPPSLPAAHTRHSP